MKQLTSVRIDLDKEFNVTRQEVNTYNVLAMNSKRLVLDDEYYTTLYHIKTKRPYETTVDKFYVGDNLKDSESIQKILGSYYIYAYVQEGVDIKKEANKALKKYISDKIAMYGHGRDVEIKWGD